MIRIDRQLLVGIGLGHLEPAQAERIQRRIYEVLSMRVGVALTDSLTNTQLDTFDRLLDSSSDEAHAYLAREIPNYAVVAQSEFNYIARAIARSVHHGRVVLEQGELEATER